MVIMCENLIKKKYFAGLNTVFLETNEKEFSAKTVALKPNEPCARRGRFPMRENERLFPLSSRSEEGLKSGLQFLS